MPTLVLSTRSTRDNNDLAQAATSLGWKVYRATNWEVHEHLVAPVVYGEIAFCDIIAEKLGLGLLETPDAWLTTLPHKYVSREIFLTTFGSALKDSRHRFYKPANDKYFEAGVYQKGQHIPYRHIRPTAPVLVSEVVEFDVEVRCYVLDRRVLTASIYKGLLWASSVAEENAILAEAEAWTQSFLDDPSICLPSAIVVDVGRLPGGWAVVEANQGYASGVYSGGYNSKDGRGADTRKVLEVVARSSRERHDVLAEDLHYLRSVSIP
jgi:hypothetical protein